MNVLEIFCRILHMSNLFSGRGSLCFRHGRAKVDLRDFAIGRKCADKFTNTFRNSMKIRILAFENSGRKYVRNFEDAIAVSKKMTIFATQ